MKKRNTTSPTSPAIISPPRQYCTVCGCRGVYRGGRDDVLCDKCQDSAAKAKAIVDRERARARLKWPRAEAASV